MSRSGIILMQTKNQFFNNKQKIFFLNMSALSNLTLCDVTVTIKTIFNYIKK